MFVTGNRSPCRLSRNESSALKTQDGDPHFVKKSVMSVRSPKKKNCSAS